jgi:hypothetical protein
LFGVPTHRHRGDVERQCLLCIFCHWSQCSMDLPPQIFCSNERVLCACWRGAVRGVMMCGAIIGSNALPLVSTSNVSGYARCYWQQAQSPPSGAASCESSNPAVSRSCCFAFADTRLCDQIFTFTQGYITLTLDHSAVRSVVDRPPGRCRPDGGTARARVRAGRGRETTRDHMDATRHRSHIASHAPPLYNR